MTVKSLHGAAAFALSVVFATTVIAQSPSQQPPPQPTPTQPPTAQTPPTTQPPATTPQRTPAIPSELRSMDGQTVTLSGCLMREADVPGATPNVAERAGIGPDFILTNVQMRSASPSGAATTAPGATAPTTGAAPSNLKVKLTKLDSDKVSENLNKQVEVTGRLAVDRNAAAATTPGATTPPRATTSDLPQLEVSALKVLGQSCTSK